MVVETELCGIERQARRTLGVQVRNTSRDELGSLHVEFMWENESPQPASLGSTTVAGGTPMKGLTLFRGTLSANESHTFYLDERYLDEQVLGRAIASLSTERYWISVMSGEQEIARIPGAQIAGVLDGLGL